MLVMQKDGKLGSSPCGTTKTRRSSPTAKFFLDAGATNLN
jgi:hypothetical protein